MDAEAYADMVPWLVFFVVDRRAGPSIAWAGGCAALTALGLVAWAYWRGRAAPIPYIALVLFAGLLGGGLASHTLDHLVGTTRAVVAASLGAAALVSLRFTPLSDPYTARLVVPAQRDDPRFVRVNRQITCSWALGSFAVAASCAVSDLVRARVPFTLFDWVVPLAAVCVTILWTSRSLEVFRLALDTTGAARDGDALAGGASVSSVRALPRTGDAAEEAPGSAGAVIHQLPLRRHQER